jgi:hypothetical protein
MNGGLYSSNEQVKRVTKCFLQLHQCITCARYFTEMENLGSWRCRYHPGEWNHNRREYTCCGEKERQDYGDYAGITRFMAFNPKEALNIPPLHSQGCCRRDCESTHKNPIPQDRVALGDVACVIPSIAEHGKKLEERPWLVRGKNSRIERKETLPEIFWHSSGY